VPRLLGLLFVLVVLEAATGHRHPHGPDFTGGQRVAVVVEHHHFGYRPWLADGPRLLQPLVGGDVRTAALAGRVVLVDRRAPPVDHAALDLDRAGGGGVDHV